MCLKFMDTIIRQHSHERSLKIILTGYFILHTQTHTQFQWKSRNHQSSKNYLDMCNFQIAKARIKVPNEIIFKI